MNLFIKQKQTHRHRKQTMVTKEDGETWINWEYRINYMLRYMYILYICIDMYRYVYICIDTYTKYTK